MKLPILFLMFGLVGCGVPCSYVVATKAFEESAIARYEAYIKADPNLTDAQRQQLLLEIEARRRATEESSGLCEDWFRGAE